MDSLTNASRRQTSTRSMTQVHPDQASAPGRMLSVSSLVDQAYELLYSRIADGVLAPGDRLVISTLAQEFGTSTIPIREALARLHANRLVSFEQFRGYRVASAPTEENIRHFFQMRLALETSAVDIAIAKVDEAAVHEMEAVNERIIEGRSGDTVQGFREFTDLNERFHKLLVGMAANPLLDAAYEQLGDHHQKVRYNAGFGTPDLARITREHNEIIRALRANDGAKARNVLSRHISYGYQRLVGDVSPLIGRPNKSDPAPAT